MTFFRKHYWTVVWTIVFALSYLIYNLRSLGKHLCSEESSRSTGTPRNSCEHAYIDRYRRYMRYQVSTRSIPIRTNSDRKGISVNSTAFNSEHHTTSNYRTPVLSFIQFRPSPCLTVFKYGSSLNALYAPLSKLFKPTLISNLISSIKASLLT